jgi:hypothetical protein
MSSAKTLHVAVESMDNRPLEVVGSASIQLNSSDITPSGLVDIADPYIADGYKLDSVYVRDGNSDLFTGAKKTYARYGHVNGDMYFRKRDKGFIFKRKMSAGEALENSNELLVVLDRNISA